MSRVPGSAALADKGVAIFGPGALGGPIAEHLTNLGIRVLHINDPDRVDPATACRTPYGVLQAGMAKVNALWLILTQKTPYTEIKRSGHRVGGVRAPDEPHEIEVLDQILSGMDLVVDATAEIGVQLALSQICSQRGIPYVLVSATPGAWGGTVAHFLPESEFGCALCWAWERRTNDQLNPAADPDGTFQPGGCADPTFTGSRA